MSLEKDAKEASERVRTLSELFREAKVGIVTLYLSGKDYKINIESLIRLGDLGNIDDSQIMQQLEEISSYLLTLGTSETDLLFLIKQLELKYNALLADKSNIIRNILIKKSNGRITDKQVQNKVFSENEDLLISKQNEINLRQTQLKRIQIIQTIFQERIGQLRSILKRRGETKGGIHGTY